MGKSRKRLVIDTATAYLYVALFEETRCLQPHYRKGQNDHSATLMSVVVQMMNTYGMAVSDLEMIVVGIGPGSYTGVRAGVVCAKVMGWAQGIPVKRVSSLALMASSAKQEGTIVPFIDARRNNVFYGVYTREAGDLHCMEDDVFSAKEALDDKRFDGTLKLSEGHPVMDGLWDSKLLVPVLDIHRLTPRYLRQTEAERSEN